MAFSSTTILGFSDVSVQVILMLLAFVFAAVGLQIRLNSSGPARLVQFSIKTQKKILLACLFTTILFACYMLYLFFSAAPGSGRLDRSTTLWYVSYIILFLSSAVAATFSGSLQMFGKEISTQWEKSVLCYFASWIAFFGAWAFYMGPDRIAEWDSMRLLLLVIANVSAFGSILFACPIPLRRLVISALVIFHFGGVTTAILNAPPNPWITQALWARVYQPYLGFLYMTNAYQFYAPDPNYSYYLWCRLEYERPNGDVVWQWIKSPDVNVETGRPNYVTSLQYQRRIAMNDQISINEGGPPAIIANGLGKPITHPILHWRLVNSPNPPETRLGDPIPKAKMQIPFDPNINPVTNQYKKPNLYSRAILASYAQHLAQRPHPEYEDAKFKTIKVYRVTHLFPSMDMIYNWKGGSEMKNLPILYQPYYMGQFGYVPPKEKASFGEFDNPFTSEEGTVWQLLDEPVFAPNGDLVSGDPMLYWLVPIIADNPRDPIAGEMKAWTFRHAGDYAWIYYPGESSPRP